MPFVRRHLDIFAVVIVLLFVLAFFAKPIFSGLPVSKVYLLANRDLLFSQFRNLQADIRWDASLFQLAVPNFFTVAQTWREGSLPLWNPYAGLGIPLIGDLQSCIFSPWRILGSLCPTIGFYNLQLILQVAFCSVGCYFLCKQLQLGTISALFVAVLYSLAPHELSFLELLAGPTFTLYPLLLLSFVRSAQKRSLLRLTLAAACTALIIFTGHALVAFSGIFAASLLFVGLSVFVYGDCKEWRKTVPTACLGIGSIALISVVFACCIIFPFLEYLQNASCYKFSRHQDVLPWQAMPYHLLHPGIGAVSPTLGVLALPLIVAGAFTTYPRRKAYFVLLGAISILYIVMCSLGPMAFIANATPLRYVPGIYYIFVTQLLLAICAGFGVQHLRESGASFQKCFLAVLVSLLITVALPPILHLCGWDSGCVQVDNQMPEAKFRLPYWLKDTALAAVFLVLLILNKRSKISPRVLAIASVALCLVSELSLSSKSLPIRPRFDFIETKVHSFLIKSGERAAPIGFDLLVANANAVYGIRSLAIHNAMFHKRFVSLMTEAKVHTDDFNILPDHNGLSKLLDYFSLTNIVSVAAVVSSDELLNSSSIASEKPVLFEQSVAILNSKVSFDPQKREVLGHLDWQLPKSESERYSFIAIVADIKGNPIWYSGATACHIKPGPKGRRQLFNYTALIPVGLSPSTPFTVGLRVLDKKRMKFLKVLPSVTEKSTTESHSTESKVSHDLLLFGTFTIPNKKIEQGENSQNRFELVEEVGPNHIRIYKNRNALPQAYLLRRIVAASSAESVMGKLTAEDFAARESAIVEIDERTGKQADSDFCRWFQPVESVNEETKKIFDELLSNNEKYPNSVFASSVVQRPTVNRVRITCAPPKPSFLVLTDFFYPGWVATIDGKETPIYCSNYAMRGIAVPAGSHVIEFNFRPRSFYLGLTLGITLLAFLFLIILRRRKGP